MRTSFRYFISQSSQSKYTTYFRAKKTTLATKAELENLLNLAKQNGKYPLEFTFVEKLDGEYVLENFGYPSASKLDIAYFIKKADNQFYIDKVIGQTEIYGDFNNFIVTNINKKFDNNFDELGSTLDETIDINGQSKTVKGATYQLPYIVKVAKFDGSSIYFAYDINEQLEAYQPIYIIHYNKKEYRLKKDISVYIGYDYANLKKPRFIATKNEKTKEYKYYKNVKDLLKDL